MSTAIETTQTIETTAPVEVKLTEETTELKISAARAAQAKDIYMECCKKLAQHISANPDTFGKQDLNKLIEAIPDPTFNIETKTKKTKKSKKAAKYTLENWKECEVKEELKKSFKTKDLKDILSAESLPISGKKDELLDRVWGITHPDEAPELPKKKARGRKKNTKKEKNEVDITSVDDSEDEQDDNATVSTEMSEEDVQAMLDNRTSIYINKEGFQCPKIKGSKEYKLVKEKGWVFNESDTEFEFAGVIQEVEGKKKLVECEAPEELMACFGEDEE